MKSLVAAGSGCLVLLAVASLDRAPDQRTDSTPPEAATAPIVSGTPVVPAAYNRFEDAVTAPTYAAPGRSVGHPVLRPGASVMTTAASGSSTNGGRAK